MSESTSIGDGVQAALAAYEELAGLGEEVEDEWTYVTDLSASWRERIEEIIAVRGDDLLSPSQEAAVAQAIDEVGRISDPHRAIDWLSTFPQIVLVALGERP